ncbi:unnamed protein product [Thelazia callipaeda]|uniref:Uncharacterized protein n=1 Tax=Thelazia callipaeda TaxID=103827 RepID=A0A0N5DAN7_THECL|nr:unnamed protein product [Thelazia callipaeda]
MATSDQWLLLLSKVIIFNLIKQKQNKKGVTFVERNERAPKQRFIRFGRRDLRFPDDSRNSRIPLDWNGEDLQALNAAEMKRMGSRFIRFG